MRALGTVATAAGSWKRLISGLSVAWFVPTIAAHARFVSLPKLELLTGTSATIASAVWNGIWWGHLRPQIERRRPSNHPTEMQHG